MCVTSLSLQAPGTGLWGPEPFHGAVLTEVRAQGGKRHLLGRQLDYLWD